MESLQAVRSRSGYRDLARRLLISGLLVVGIIVGLVGMHSLNLHGSAAAHSPAAVSTVASDATSGAAVVQGAPSDTGDHHGACVGCLGGDHVAMSCVLALLLALLILTPPRLLRRLTVTPPWMDPHSRNDGRVQSSTPSLRILCISRT